MSKWGKALTRPSWWLWIVPPFNYSFFLPKYREYSNLIIWVDWFLVTAVVNQRFGDVSFSQCKRSKWSPSRWLDQIRNIAERSLQLSWREAVGRLEWRKIEHWYTLAIPSTPPPQKWGDRLKEKNETDASNRRLNKQRNWNVDGTNWIRVGVHTTVDVEKTHRTKVEKNGTRQK